MTTLENLYFGNVNPSELLNIHLKDDELNDIESKVIKSYRAKKGLQSAINVLLGVI